MPTGTGYDLSPTEAAKVIGVHVETLKKWARDGKIASFVTPGGWRRFRRSDLDAFLTAHTADVEAASA
jgi:excisionase family DNA binding protein